MATNPMLEQQAAPAPDPSAAQDPSQDPAQEQGGDTGPLSNISVDPAEDGGSVITHTPKVPDRVKHIDHDHVRPKKHVAKNHEELMKHLEHHTKRLKA